MQLTPAELAALKSKFSQYRGCGGPFGDVLKLVYEVERLRAENDRVFCANCHCSIPRSASKPDANGDRICVDYAVRSACHVLAEKEMLQEEIERLQRIITAMQKPSRGEGRSAGEIMEEAGVPNMLEGRKLNLRKGGGE